MPRPTTGRFLRNSGLTNGQSTSFMHASISAKCQTVASGWYEKYRAVLRDDEKGVDKVGDISATRRRRKRRSRCSSASFSVNTGACYASLKAKGYVFRRRRGRQQGAGQPTHEAGRHALEYRRRTERPHLQGVDDVRPFRCRVAGDNRNVRRKRKPDAERYRGLTVEILIPETKTRFYKNRSAPRPRCREKCELVDGGGKPNVVGCIIRLDEEKFKGALGIVDSDYDIFVGEKMGTDNIVTTDAHDLECILCRSSALDTVLAEYGDSSKIEKFQQETKKSVRTALLERAMPFGRLRLAALRRPVIEMKKIKVPQFVEEKTWSVKCDELIRESTKSGLPEEIQELQNRVERSEVGDPWYVVQGHDLLQILRIGLRHVLGDIRPGIGTEEIARILRAALPLEDLRNTGMWTDIRSWESLNPPYEILAN